MRMKLSLLALVGFALACSCGGGDATDAEGTIEAVKVPYTGRFSADPLLTPKEVMDIPMEERRLVRNEIYARHGRTFEDAALKAHFEAQPWYSADAAYSDALLSANDKANVELIKSFEDTADPLKAGEFGGTDASGGVGLSFTDKMTVALVTGDVYESEPQTRQWEAEGQWVYTWQGPGGRLAPSAMDMQAWQLDYKKKQVLGVVDLTP